MRNTIGKSLAVFLLCGVLTAGALTGCTSEPDAPASSTQESGASSSASSTEGEMLVTEGSDPSESTESSGTTTSGKQQDPTKNKTTTTSRVTTPVTWPTAKPGLYQALKGTTVQVPVFAEPDALTRKQANEFEKTYGATVKFTVYGWQEYQARIIQMVGAGSPPDITPMFDQQYLGYVGQKIITSVENYVDMKDPVWDKELCSLYNWGGTMYGVSTASDLGVFGIYYNKDMFEENDVEDPYEQYKKGQWTFENFRKAAKELTVFKDGNRTQTGFACWKWDILVMANGGTGIQLGDKNTISITLGKTNEIKAFELIQQMQLEDKSFDYAMASKDNYFQAGRIAMISERPGYSSLYYKGKFDVGWVPLPKGPDVSGEIAPCIVRAWAIPRGAKNPEGGMAWIYSGIQYQKKHANDADVKKNQADLWPVEANRKAYEDYMSRAKLLTSFIGGCNNWDKSTRWGFWEEIFVKNTPPATAVTKHQNELQYEIDQVLKGLKK